VHTLGGAETVVTIFLAVFAIAIAGGSALAAWLSAGRIVLPTPSGHC
jgi:acyl-[acyl-carrier-protein]-phospholipid O-acyltransferase/long-chain-fatty-acid--[acyl-carrier-protein] ligase